MGIKTMILPALLLLAATASARPSKMDSRFMRDAFKDNRIDVDLGRLALKKGRTAGVRDFGARAVSDHDRAQDDLIRIAKEAGLTIPGEMGGRNSAMYLRLQRMDGGRFDRAYKTAIIRSHRKDIAEYEREIQATQVPALRDYAKKALLILRRHLFQIQTVRI